MKHFFLYVLAILSLVACQFRTPTFDKNDIAIIPKPVKMEMAADVFEIKSGAVVSMDNQAPKKAVRFLTDMLLKAGGINLQVVEQKSQADFVFRADTTLPKEGYRIKITTEKVEVSAGDEAGYFYAVQTIRQLLPFTIELSSPKISTLYLPCGDIEDYPRFAWRGGHLDVSRHFYSIDEVKKFIDYLAFYKLNIFHMHLTDDEGWRLEIKKYPLLTEKGAWRVESSHDKICKKKAETDTAFIIDPAKYQMREGKKMYGGFYTQDQIRDLIQYADNRCVTIVPEIDMPGHFKAAIDHYPYLSCTGKAGWGKIFSTPACLAKKETFDFVKDVLTEVAELFPSQYIHIGGDEVNIQSWKACKKCQRRIRQLKLKDEHQYQSHFNQEIEKFLKSKGKRLLGWDEIVEGGITKDATMMWWRGWAPEMRDKAANNGNEMIITPSFRYYLNQNNADRPLKQVYDYEPVPKTFTMDQAKQVKGVQACFWGEWIANFKRLQYQMFPRIMALAETAWTGKSAKNYDDFMQRLSKQYDRLDAMHIYYYIAPPDIGKHLVLVDSTLINMGKSPNGMTIYYTTDGTRPNKQSKKYEKPFYVTDNGMLKAIMYRGDVSSEVMTTKIEKQNYMSALNIEAQSGQINRCVVLKKCKDVENAHLPQNPQWTLVKTIDMGEYANHSSFALFFDGYFKAEKDGVYTFSTRSDDGSLLYINNKLVVDNGKNHSVKNESGAIALAKGWHHLKIAFYEAGGEGALSVYYAPQGEALKLLQGEVIGCKGVN